LGGDKSERAPEECQRASNVLRRSRRKLRKKSVEYLTLLPFDGYAISGSLENEREALKEHLG